MVCTDGNHFACVDESKSAVDTISMHEGSKDSAVDPLAGDDFTCRYSHNDAAQRGVSARLVGRIRSRWRAESERLAIRIRLRAQSRVAVVSAGECVLQGWLSGHRSAPGAETESTV